MTGDHRNSFTTHNGKGVPFPSDKIREDEHPRLLAAQAVTLALGRANMLDKGENQTHDQGPLHQGMNAHARVRHRTRNFHPPFEA
jgi:hypothetical protein